MWRYTCSQDKLFCVTAEKFEFLKLQNYCTLLIPISLHHACVHAYVSKRKILMHFNVYNIKHITFVFVLHFLFLRVLLFIHSFIIHSRLFARLKEKEDNSKNEEKEQKEEEGMLNNGERGSDKPRGRKGVGEKNRKTERKGGGGERSRDSPLVRISTGWWTADGPRWTQLDEGRQEGSWIRRWRRSSSPRSGWKIGVDAARRENVVSRPRQPDDERRRELRLPVQDRADRRLRHGQDLRGAALQVRHVRRAPRQHHRRRLYHEDRAHRREKGQGALRSGAGTFAERLSRSLTSAPFTFTHAPHKGMRIWARRNEVELKRLPFARKKAYLKLPNVISFEHSITLKSIQVMSSTFKSKRDKFPPLRECPEKQDYYFQIVSNLG